MRIEQGGRRARYGYAGLESLATVLAGRGRLAPPGHEAETGAPETAVFGLAGHPGVVRADPTRAATTGAACRELVRTLRAGVGPG